MKNYTKKINWRTVIGGLALIAAITTIFALMIYGSRTSAARISGSVTIIATITFLVTGGLQQLQFFRSRQFTRGSASSLYTLAIIGTLVLVNVVAAQTSWRWDMTAASEHSLSEQTQTVLRDLDQDIEILAFFPEGSGIGYEVEDLLTEYAYLSPRISIRFVDPERQPGLAREYDVSRAYTTVLESGGQRRTISGYNLYDFASQDDPSQAMFRGEQAFTRAIIDLTQSVGANVYFMTGHGEADLYEEYSVLRAYLGGEGYRAAGWNPGRDGPIPEDADLIVIAGPTRDLHPQEAADLMQYADAGGRLLILADTMPGSNRQFVNLAALVEHLGVQMRPDVVMDPARGYYMDPMSPVPRMDYHPVTKKLIDHGLLVVLPRARSFVVVEDPPDDLSIQRLLFSSPDSWGEIDPADEDERFEEAQGPLALAYAVARSADDAGEPPTEGTEISETPMAVIIGDADFISNEVFGFQGNSDLFMNSVQWLLDQTDLISIRPKEPVMRQIFISPTEGRMIFYGSTLGLPLIILVIGMTVWLRRRHL